MKDEESPIVTISIWFSAVVVVGLLFYTVAKKWNETRPLMRFDHIERNFEYDYKPMNKEEKKRYRKINIFYIKEALKRGDVNTNTGQVTTNATGDEKCGQEQK